MCAAAFTPSLAHTHALILRISTHAVVSSTGVLASAPPIFIGPNTTVPIPTVLLVGSGGSDVSYPTVSKHVFCGSFRVLGLKTRCAALLLLLRPRSSLASESIVHGTAAYVRSHKTLRTRHAFPGVFAWESVPCPRGVRVASHMCNIQLTPKHIAPT